MVRLLGDALSACLRPHFVLRHELRQVQEKSKNSEREADAELVRYLRSYPSCCLSRVNVCVRVRVERVVKCAFTLCWIPSTHVVAWVLCD